jgi:hypothetical protein
MHVGSDARIESIEVNPAPFEPGTATLTAAGRGQVARLAGFLEQLPEVKMGMTPVVSSGDVASIKRRSLEAALEGLASKEQLSKDASVMRLFEQRFPNRPAPTTPEATFAALLEQEPTPTSAAPELAAHRLEVVRATLKDAGIDAARLVDMKPVEREASEVAFDVRQPETPQPSRLREALKRLGVPLKGSDAEE